MSKNILLVDDEVYTMVSMVEHLSFEGYTIDSVINPSQALDALREKHFDALIVDCVMETGRHAGADLIKEIRSDSPSVPPENTKIPILVLTAVCDQNILEDLNKSNVQAVMQKPVSTYELLKKLDSLIEDKN